MRNKKTDSGRNVTNAAAVSQNARKAVDGALSAVGLAVLSLVVKQFWN